LDRLVPKIIALRVRKHPLVVSRREEWLLKKIEAGVSSKWSEDYRQLIEKRRATRLTAGDRRRLEKLTAQLDQFQLQWLKWATELATIRGVTLPNLLKGLKLQRPDYV
jgi:hypothetical protein